MPRGRGQEFWVAAALGLAVFAVYAGGACRTIYVGDSGELVTAVHLLGIPHPSGYPLYVMLGKLWTLLLPVGSIAFRMSLFSAACAALSVATLYGLSRSLALSRGAALFGALLFAFAPSVWAEANVQRVYALGALFVVLASWAAWRWAAGGGGGRLALAFFLCGLGAANHTFMAVYAAALALFALIADPFLARRPRNLAACSGAFAVGMLPYLYLPIRSGLDPALDWGDPETLDRFLGVVLRRGFWQRRWYSGPGDLVPIAGDYVAGLGRDLAWAGLVLAFAGAVAWLVAPARFTGTPSGAEPASASKARRLFPLLPLLVMTGNLAALALHGSRADIFVWHRYYIPSVAMGALLAAAGAHALVAGRRIAVRGAPLLVPLAAFAVGWAPHDRSRYRIAEDFSTLVLESVAPGAHLIAEDDNILFTLMYLHFVEGKRPDVDLIMQGVGGQALPPLRFEPASDPLYLTHHPNWTVPGLEIVPVGVVFRAWREGAPRPLPQISKRSLDGEDDPRVPKDFLTRNLVGHFHYMLGLSLEASDWPGARREFEKAMRAAPGSDVLFFNLGLIFRRAGLLEDALDALRRSRTIDPRPTSGRGRRDAADLITEIEREKARLERIEARLVGSDAELEDLAAGSAAFHRRMAARLEEVGEPLAAGGHVRLAEEIERKEFPH